MVTSLREEIYELEELSKLSTSISISKKEKRYLLQRGDGLVLNALDTLALLFPDYVSHWVLGQDTLPAHYGSPSHAREARGYQLVSPTKETR